MPDPSHTLKRSPLLAGAIVVISLATSLAPVSGLIYTVEPGDALSTIAGDYGVTVDQLVEANNLGDPNLILAGFTLTIPGAADEPVADSAPTVALGATHSVESGESLWAIAALYGVGLQALTGLNNIGPNGLIHPGQELALPAGGSSITATVAHDTSSDHQTASDSRASAAPNFVLEHTVSAGDTLWGIAASYGVGLDDLLKTNTLDRTSIITVGQTLVLPAKQAIDTTGLPSDLASDPRRLALMPVFEYWAEQYAVPADLLKALAWFESGWNNEKRSSAAAIGIGQLLPITAEFVSDSLLGEVLDPYVPEDNIQMSARYLRYLLDQTRDVRFAVASYYQGLTATRQHGIYGSSVFYVDGVIAMRSRFE